jgi:hypothetical protein
MARSLTYNQWEALLLFYQQKPTKGSVTDKRTYNSFLERGWIEITEDDRVGVTDLGQDKAKEIAELYKRY